jgi:putative salt-induced outer membrane protein YdiY
MKRYILIALALVAGMACVRAGDTNRLALADYEALAVADSVAHAGDAAVTHTVVATTNKPAWESAVTFGVTLTSGNSDTFLANSTIATHRNNPTNEWSFGADASYGENNAIKSAEILHGFGQYNHLFTERWFGYVRADGLHDGIADVTYRFTLSPGAGYYFIKTKATTLAGEAGPGVVFEKLDGQRKTYLTPRLAERFEHKMDDHTRIWQNLEFLPQVDKRDNFLVNAELGIEAALTKKLSLRTVVDETYANIPAPGRKNNDVKLISGLAYKF